MDRDQKFKGQKGRPINKFFRGRARRFAPPPELSKDQLFRIIREPDSQRHAIVRSRVAATDIYPALNL